MIVVIQPVSKNYLLHAIVLFTSLSIVIPAYYSGLFFIIFFAHRLFSNHHRCYYICEIIIAFSRMTRQTLHLLLFFFFLTNYNLLYAQAKYEGFGSGTRGGKGKPKVHVTNLNAKGPGSLYAAMGSNRIVVFEVGGTINNFRWDASDENVVVSNLTIDGSTAPAPGITLNNSNNGNGLSFQNGCHDIIISNIRVRNAGNDGFNLVNRCHDIVFDHVSSANNSDGDLDITDSCYNITVQWSILGHSVTGPMLIAYPGTKDISIHHNLFNSTGSGIGERNPLVHNATDYQPNIISYLMVDFTNNIVWKWGNSNGGFGYGSCADYGGTLQARNNFYQSASQPESAIIKDHDSKGSKVYASGNVSGNKGINPNSVSNVSSPWIVAPVTTQDACTAARKVLAEAGPRPLDATDKALIAAVLLASCPADVQNKLPVANAGHDIILTLPAKPVVLAGSGFDSDGTITRYAWSRVSGPATFKLGMANAAVTTLSNFVKGVYVFRLTVIDNKGATAMDNVTVTVNAAPRQADKVGKGQH
jgi:hypothetical protein